MRSVKVLLCGFSALLGGCGERVLQPAAGSRLVTGVIDIGGSLDSAIVGPAGGSVGEPLTYRVTTFGNDCVTAAGAQVINQGLQMTIIPLDSVSPGPCLDVLRSIPRDVTVVFDRSGTALLRLQGESWGGRTPVSVTRQLPILP